jgi:hypothetical protein
MSLQIQNNFIVFFILNYLKILTQKIIQIALIKPLTFQLPNSINFMILIMIIVYYIDVCFFIGWLK